MSKRNYFWSHYSGGSGYNPRKKRRYSEDDGYCWPLTENKKVRINVYEGRTLVDLRNYYEQDWESYPGKYGISLTVFQWQNLLKVSEEITEAIDLIKGGVKDVIKLQLQKLWVLENQRKVRIKKRAKDDYVVDIREFYVDDEKDGKSIAGKKGFYLEFYLWKKLLEVVDEINAALEDFE